ncbi:hypothetical protein PRIPAC_85129, partial [Pristionchus pacificus]|uniref:Uncharacterized protein n=1 Tax=Pristionchus pacificus TaxID=54126 RepID=A0A2A6BTS7_PRIPA
PTFIVFHLQFAPIDARRAGSRGDSAARPQSNGSFPLPSQITNGTYLIHANPIRVNLTNGVTCDRWRIGVDYSGKVALRSNCTAYPMFLRANSAFSVNATSQPGADGSSWSPMATGNGAAWSFKSDYGTFLSVGMDGRLSLIGSIGANEQFAIGPFRERSPAPRPNPTTTTTRPPPPSPPQPFPGPTPPNLITTTTTAKPSPPKPPVLQQRIKTTSGKYLRSKPSFTNTLKAYCSSKSPVYLRATPDEKVDVSEWREGDPGLVWTKVDYGDRSYSFKSVHGTYLSAAPDGEVSLKKNVIDDEKFWMEPWTDTPRQPEKASGSSDDVKAGIFIVGLIVVFITAGCVCMCCCGGKSEKKDEKDLEPLTMTTESTPTTTPLDDNYCGRFQEPEINRPQLHYAEFAAPSAPMPAFASLSAQIAGQRSIRSVHNFYLRAWQGEEGQYDWYVDMAPHCDECERWEVEDRNGKVLIKAHCFPAKYLRANQDGSVDLADHAQDWELWTPMRNHDGSWSFQSHHGTWLRSSGDGQVSLQTHCMADEQFTIEEW